jgi:hypothetical protein
LEEDEEQCRRGMQRHSHTKGSRMRHAQCR